jgi:hypothetical protein
VARRNLVIERRHHARSVQKGLDEQIPRTTFLLHSESEDPHSQAPYLRYLVPVPSRRTRGRGGRTSRAGFGALHRRRQLLTERGCPADRRDPVMASSGDEPWREGCIYSDRGHDQQVFIRAVRPAPNRGRAQETSRHPGRSVANRAIVDRPHSPDDVIPPPPSGRVRQTGVIPQRHPDHQLAATSSPLTSSMPSSSITSSLAFVSDSGLM